MTGASVAFGVVVAALVFAFFYRVTRKQRRAAQARGGKPVIAVNARPFQIAGAVFLVVAVAHGILAAVTGAGWQIGMCAVSFALAGWSFLIAKSRLKAKSPDA